MISSRTASSAHLPTPFRSRRFIALVAAATLILQMAVAWTLPSQAAGAADGVPLTVSSLKTNDAANPLGISLDAPKFKWQLSSDERDTMQTAYQVRVASSATELANSAPDVWNSGRVASDASVGIAYEGPALDAKARYFWQVKVWDNHGTESAWSDAAWFETGLANSDWSADWIGGESADDALAEWTDYAVSTTVSSVSGAVGVFFRSVDAQNGFMWQLSNSGGANTLRPHIRVNGGYTALADVPIPAAALNGGGLSGGPNTLTIEVSGDVITSSMNGTQIDVRTDSRHPRGRIGFRTDDAETGIVNAISVTKPGGKVLVSTSFPLGDRTFAGGTVDAAGEYRVGNPGGDVFLAGVDAAPIFRSEFDVSKTIRSARLYASALGVYEFSINGERVGDQELAPGWTDYETRVQYQTYDVTELLSSGSNAIGAMLAKGWYAGNLGWFGPNQYGTDPKLLGQLEITYTDGSTDTVGTDSAWKTTRGPILAADLLNGETFDANRIDDGWNTVGHSDAGWNSVTNEGDLATSRLVAQVDPPVRVTQELAPRTVTEVSPGTWVFDLGQNMVGKVRLNVPTKAGQTVRIRHAEVLHANGTISMENLRSAQATDYFTASGTGAETYTPRFTFHGFRYVELTGLTEAPTLDSIRGLVLRTDGELTSTFTTSDPMVNQLQSNIVWGQKGNFLSIPTDTPARDERLGWTGDINVFASTAVFNMDSLAFLRKWMADMRDAQHPNGAYPEVAPQFCTDPAVHSSCGAGSTGWADAGITVPWTLWNGYGDTEIITENYESMQQYIAYLESISPGFIRPNAGTWGDWLNLGDNVPGNVLGTAFYAHSVDMMAQMSEAVGETADAERYTQLFENIRTAFIERFVSVDGTVSGGSQTGYAIAIEFGLVPDELRAAAGAKLAAAVAAKGGHLATGFLGTSFLLPALSATGQSDVAYQLLLNRTFPSWGFQIDRGATTMWERWDSIKEDGTFGDIGMNSFNHYAYGAVGHWMYTTIAGLSSTEPGYKHFTVAPKPGGSLTYAATTFESTHGAIATDWETSDDSFLLNVTVPANTTATVQIPAASLPSVLERGVPSTEAEGVHSATFADGVVTLEVGSGSYEFAADEAVGELTDLEQLIVDLGVVVENLTGEGALTSAQGERILDRQQDLLAAARAALGSYLDADRATATSAVHDGLAQLTEITDYLEEQNADGAIDDSTVAVVADAATQVTAALSMLSARLLGIDAYVSPNADTLLPGQPVVASVLIDNAGTQSVTDVTAELTTPAPWEWSQSTEPLDEVEPAGSSELVFEGTIPLDQGPGDVAVSGMLSYSYAGSRATVPVSGSLAVDSPIRFDGIVVDPAEVAPEQGFVVRATVVNDSDFDIAGTVTAQMPDGWLPARADAVQVVAPGASLEFTVRLTAPLEIAGSGAEIGLSFVNGGASYANATAMVATPMTAYEAEVFDHIDLGDDASEISHALTASAQSGTDTEAGLTRRYANRADSNGFYEFTMDVQAGQPFTIKAIETYDMAHTKEYDILVNGEAVHRRLNRSSGAGTQAFSFIVDDTALSADGQVTVRFQNVAGVNYDPSIADVWTTAVYDHVDLGNAASEQAHSLTASALSGTNTEAGLDRRYANRSDPTGYFEFVVDVEPGEPFVVRSIETYDSAQTKEYTVLANDVIVHERLYSHTTGMGTETFQFLVDDPAITQSGEVTLRFENNESGVNYDPSIADVWVFGAGGDAIAPVVTSTVDAAAGTGTFGWFTGSVNVTLQGHDNRAGDVAIERRIGTGDWRDYGDPFSIDEQGETEVAYRGTDVAGNTGDAETIIVKIDSDAPVTEAVVSPESGATTLNPASITFAATDAASGVARTQHRVDDGRWQTWDGTAITLSAPGAHEVTYRSTDAAGNQESDKSVSLTIDVPATVDEVAPTVSLDVSHPGAKGWFLSDATATLDAVDTGSGVATVEYSLNGAAWTPYEAGIKLPDGLDTLRYRATDVAGNVSEVGSREFKVDSVAPTMWAWVSDSGRVTAVASDELAGVDRIEYSLDEGQNWVSGLTAVLTIDAEPETVQLRSVDAAGNSSATQTVSRADTAPLLTVEPGQTLLVEASGFRPGQTVRVELSPDATALAEAVANGGGVISVRATVPADTSGGERSLVLVAVDVPDDGNGDGDGDGNGDGDGGDTPNDGDGTRDDTDTDTGNETVTIPAEVLASTGAAPSPWIALGGLLLAAGAAIFFLARRRRNLLPSSANDR